MDNLPDTKTESTIEPSSKSEEDEALDPRVPIEFERLNHANEAINHLELQLDEARKTLKEFQDASEADLFQLEKSIGSAVSKAKCYYDTRIKLRDAKEILTKAKHRFERAQALHVSARELASVSRDYIREALKSNQNPAVWKETYDHAMAKAQDADREKHQADIDQQSAEQVYFEIKNSLEQLQKEFRRSINKSQPYYERKAEYHKELDFQKGKIYALEECVSEAKSQYQESLKNLESISNEIHAQRKQDKLHRELEERTEGVGEEQLDLIEEPLSLPSKTDNIPTITFQLEPILRTEFLPMGIFRNTNDRHSSGGDEITNDFNNQFTLRSKQTTVMNNYENETNHLVADQRERFLSSSSLVSQTTNEDDDDDQTGSLHVLSDEQLDDLATVNHPYPLETSSQTDTIDELISQLQYSKLQAQTFFRNLFKTNSINHN